ncbi:MAG: ion transporter [Cytophagales bacterium]|nr:MAG: ion transporter [Cytophagales bacterium]
MNRERFAEIFDLNPKVSSFARGIDNFIYVIILVSTLVVTLETIVPIEYIPNLQAFETIVTIIFVSELLFKLSVIDILFARHQHLWERVLLVAYLLIDIAAVVPPIIFLFNKGAHHDYFLTLRLLRIFKAFQHDHSIELILRAVIRKRTELIKSALVVVVVTIFMSVLLYEVENDFEFGGAQASKSTIKDIFSALTWAFAIFVDDATGHIDAGLTPITSLGKLIAAFIGLLKIGIVVIPTGIIATGFMEVIEENKLKNKHDILKEAFRKKFNDVLQIEVFERPRTIFTLRDALFINEHQIFNILENNQGFRVRAVQSDEQEKYVDTNLIEHYAYQELPLYGAKIDRENGKHLIISPNSNADVGIGYFSYCLSEMLQADLISNELYQKNSLSLRYDFDFLNNDLYWKNEHSEMKKSQFAKLPIKQQAIFRFKEDILKLKEYQHILIVEAALIENDFEIEKMNISTCTHQLMMWLCSHSENVFSVKVKQKVLENYSYFDSVKKLSDEVKVLIK